MISLAARITETIDSAWVIPTRKRLIS